MAGTIKNVRNLDDVYTNAIRDLEQRILVLENRRFTPEAGAVQQRNFADLPTAGVKGRLFYVLDGRKAGEGAGAGTGVLAVDDEIGGVATWVRVDDPTQALQV